jgi:dipeptidase E
MMKLLLTDSGIRNASIQDALVDRLGKPVAEANALCIPTAGYGARTGTRAGPGVSPADSPPAG